MSIDLHNKRLELLKKVDDEIDKKIQPSDAKLVKEFAKQYYLSIAPEELLSRSIIDIYGSLISHWHFIANRKPNELKLRIFNPSQEQDGWQSTHTIIEIVQDDIPFLIDSIRMALNSLDISIHLMIYLEGVAFERDKSGTIINILPLSKKVSATASIEAPLHIEIDKITDKKVLNKIKDKILAVLDDVKLSVTDWSKMIESLTNSIERVKKIESDANHKSSIQKDELAESLKFLEWLRDDNFTLLGYCDYSLSASTTNEHYKFEPIKNSELGLFKKFDYQNVCHFSDLPPAAKKFYFAKRLIIMGKINILSTVHRPVYIDFISVKKFDKAGNITGEESYIGLYTAVAYNMSTTTIPLIRKKVQNVLDSLGMPPRSHDYKVLLNIIENLPRDDVFHATEEQLQEISIGILHLQERPIVRLFIRKDIFGRFFSCLIFVPREIFSSELRQKYQDIILEALSGQAAFFYTKFSESILARIHFVVRIDPQQEINYDVKEIEQKLIDISRTWNNNFQEVLEESIGEEKGNELFKTYKNGNAFSAGYKENFMARSAVLDIQHIEALVSQSAEDIEMSLYHAIEDEDKVLRFKLFHQNIPMPLSDVVPILENLGLRVISERPYVVNRSDGKAVWVNDYRMLYCQMNSITASQIREIFQEAFAAIWHGDAENDRFNRLVLTAKVTWREVTILRAYYKYLWQTGLGVSQNSVEDALFNNTDIAVKLVKLFDLRFNPGNQNTISKQEQLKLEIEQDLVKVKSLTDDTILRKFVAVIFATIRTNHYQRNKHKQAKEYLSFKLESDKVPDLPLPKPLYEIWVYSPRVEGIHLRAAKVARGGIRWSDRPEDFRTEILGLMKAQQVKNAVIVPLGAKGGFVVKRLAEIGDDKDAKMQEVVNCYKMLMRGLLDLTDNRVNGSIVVPNNVVRYDVDDPYLVVAADKGTATFSDIANELSKEYKFWLSDAFASGGSVGYDHKKMGITARGVWESVKLHFQHLGIDTQTQPFTVVGIGDMAGDVFGNGLLLSKFIKLVAAFNHMHIFIDPNPDLNASFAERQRLFDLPRSTWMDYKKELISKGGGIFERAAKSIPISSEMKALFGITQDAMLPNELIKAIFRAKIDLLYNGGIGTFFKSTTETHANAGDRSSDLIRINGIELGARVVGEGGNLGFTQLARIEYAKKGGLINTDAIDNSAGVNCSDNEVNIKVLLNEIVRTGDLTEKQRNILLAEMTNEVAELVLINNIKQNKAITIICAQAASNLGMHGRLLDELEETANLDRVVEFLPDKEELENRKNLNTGLTRPEVAVILAYTKIQLKKELLDSSLPEEKYFQKELVRAFPKQIREKYAFYLEKHRLKREIIVTQISNFIIDEMGISFFHRLRDETGAKSPAIVQCYVVARHILQYDVIIEKINNLRNKVDYNLQLSINFELNRLLRRATRWFLQNRRTGLNIDETITMFHDKVQTINANLPKLLHGDAVTSMRGTIDLLIKEKIPQDLASEVAKMPSMFSALDIVEAANLINVDVLQFANAYFLIGAKLSLDWFRDKIKDQKITDHWDALARAAFRDDIDRQQRNITAAILHTKVVKEQQIVELVSGLLEKNQLILERWGFFVKELKTGKVEFTMFAVAIRELLDISQAFSFLLQK